MHAKVDTRPLIARLLVRRFEYRHPLAWGGLLFAGGLCLFVLGAIVCSAGYWWGVPLMAAAALQMWAAHVLLSTTGH